MASLANGNKFFGPHSATGSVTGTGSAITIQCGFKPIKVHLLNLDDAGGATDAIWFQGMPDASARLWIDSGANTTNGSYITSDGITVGNSGFVIGADANINASGESIAWYAERA